MTFDDAVKGACAGLPMEYGMECLIYEYYHIWHGSVILKK